MIHIEIENIVIHANHGVLWEEEKIGSDYRVDLKLKVDVSKACDSDELDDTISYVVFNQIIHEEMAIRSKLIEHVAGRIARRIFAEEAQVEWLELKVAKRNPPMGGNVQEVRVILTLDRKDL